MEYLVSGPISRVAIIAIATLTLALGCCFTCAYDPSPLQNICVAASDHLSSVFVNGKTCKDPKLVTVEDFIYSGFQIAGNTNNAFGYSVNIVDVNQLPGLNTLGVSIGRGDVAPGGVIPLHLHPRASEILLVTEGTVFVGFVDSTAGTKSKVFAKVLKTGDAIAIPIGLVHFTMNVGKTNATVIAAFNSQDIGFVRIPGDLFGTDPSIPPELLAKGFQLDKKQVEYLQSLSW